MTPAWMTADEVAVHLRFPTVKAFYQWLSRNHDLPRVRRGRGRLLFERQQVDAYLRGELRQGRRSSGNSLRAVGGRR